METNNRKTPLMEGTIFIYVLLGIAAIVFGYAINEDVVAILSVAIGIGLIGWVLWNLLSPTSDRNVFLRSLESTSAEVVRKYSEEWRDSYGGTYYTYHMVLDFRAYKTGTDSINIRLDARVKKEIYNRYKSGASISIRYAKDNPRIALVGGEY
jgi:hypothetical protein